MDSTFSVTDRVGYFVCFVFCFLTYSGNIVWQFAPNYENLTNNINTSDEAWDVEKEFALAKKMCYFQI